MQKNTPDSKIESTEEIHIKIKEFEHSMKKIVRIRYTILIAFLLIMFFVIGFSVTYMYSNPIYPPLCLFIFISDFIMIGVSMIISNKKEKQLIISMNKYSVMIDEFYKAKQDS